MNQEKLKEVISDAFYNYRHAYRAIETSETCLPPRDKYPDIVSYITAKVVEYLQES